MGAPIAAAPVISIDRANSPWQGYTNSAEEEARGKSIAAVAIAADFERLGHLARFAVGGDPLLAIDRKQRRVVVNARFFSNLQRADGTRIRKDEMVTVGKVIDGSLRMRGRDLVTFLLCAELIQTYLHIGSKLMLAEERDDAGAYTVHVEGTHVYFTNHRHEPSFQFDVRIDKKTGDITVVGK